MYSLKFFQDLTMRFLILKTFSQPPYF